MRGVRGPNDPKDARVDSTLVRGKEEARAFHDKGAEDKLVGKTVMGRYKLVELIGQGGMGNVYLAEDMRLSKRVAVKVLPDYFGKMTSVAERFVQEALLAPRIDHENIIDVTDRGKTGDGVPFFVMEYLKGTDLAGALSAGGRMPWCERTRDIILQMCRGLQAAHEKGIVHRDMKPENVFLVERSDSRAFVKLFDFGIAKLVESAREEGTPDGGMSPIPLTRTGVTQAGSVMGTPQYMAPEQASGGDIDQRVDVYAVGTIIYEVLCGRAPFVLEAKESPMADALKILDMQKNAAPMPPRTLRPGANIPPELEAVIMKALSKSREERFGSMKEMEEAILAIPVPEEAEPPRSSANGLAAIKDLRPGSRSASGYMEIMRREAARRRSSVRKAVVAAVVAGALAAGGAGVLIERHYAHGEAEQHDAAPAQVEKADGGKKDVQDH